MRLTLCARARSSCFVCVLIVSACHAAEPPRLHPLGVDYDTELADLAKTIPCPGLLFATPPARDAFSAASASNWEGVPLEAESDGELQVVKSADTPSPSSYRVLCVLRRGANISLTGVHSLHFDWLQ